MTNDELVALIREAACVHGQRNGTHRCLDYGNGWDGLHPECVVAALVEAGVVQGDERNYDERLVDLPHGAIGHVKTAKRGADGLTDGQRARFTAAAERGLAANRADESTPAHKFPPRGDDGLTDNERVWLTSRGYSVEHLPFDENNLRADIVKVWGEHGAHIDVFDHIDKLAQEHLQLLRKTEAAVRAAMGYSDPPGVFGERRTQNVLGNQGGGMVSVRRDDLHEVVGNVRMYDLPEDAYVTVKAARDRLRAALASEGDGQ